MTHLHDKPLAAPGLISYRYKGAYGYIMIGARNDADAMREAQASMSRPQAINRANLQVWNGVEYVDYDTVQQ